MISLEPVNQNKNTKFTLQPISKWSA